MLAGLAFVAVFVVASDARHELLAIGKFAGLHFSQKVHCLSAAQRAGQAAVMQNFHVTGFALVKELDVKVLYNRFDLLNSPQYFGDVRKTAK